MQRICHSFRKDSPPASDPEYFVRGGALRSALRTALLTTVSRLPAAADSLQRVREFERDLYPLVQFRTRHKAASVDGDRGSSVESDRSRSSTSGTAATKSGAAATRQIGKRQGPGGAGTGPNKKGRQTAAGTGAATVKVKEEKTTVPPDTPCPYYLAEQLGIPTKADATVLFKCLDGNRCVRGQHVRLSELTRKRARSVFEVPPVKGYYVATKAIEALEDLPPGAFKRVGILTGAGKASKDD